MTTLSLAPALSLATATRTFSVVYIQDYTIPHPNGDLCVTTRHELDQALDESAAVWAVMNREIGKGGSMNSLEYHVESLGEHATEDALIVAITWTELQEHANKILARAEEIGEDTIPVNRHGLDAIGVGYVHQDNMGEEDLEIATEIDCLDSESLYMDFGTDVGDITHRVACKIEDIARLHDDSDSYARAVIKTDEVDITNRIARLSMSEQPGTPFSRALRAYLLEP